MTTVTFPSRVAARASEVKFSRVILTILALPLYVLGFLVGLLIVAASWMFAAAAVGASDARARSRNAPEAES